MADEKFEEVMVSPAAFLWSKPVTRVVVGAVLSAVSASLSSLPVSRLPEIVPASLTAVGVLASAVGRSSAWVTVSESLAVVAVELVVLSMTV